MADLRRRLDRLERRAPLASGWPGFLMVGDEAEKQRVLAELGRRHGPRPEGRTLFVMVGVGPGAAPRDEGDGR